MKQTSDKKKEKDQLGDYQLIQCQILQTNIARTIQQTVRRITNEILGVKRLIQINFIIHFDYNLNLKLLTQTTSESVNDCQW